MGVTDVGREDSIVNGHGRDHGGANSKRRAHLLMILFEEQGHYIVLLQLLYFLSSFDIVVTVCTSDRRVKHLEQLRKDGDFKSLDLRLVLLADEAGTTTNKQGPPGLFGVAWAMKQQFQAYREKLVAETDPNAKPSCIVADGLLDWSADLAQELRIPRYIVFTTAGWIPYTTFKWSVEGPEQFTPGNQVEVPGRFTAPSTEIPSFLYPLARFDNLAGCLINTFEELEGEKCVEASRSYLKRTPNSKCPRFFPVGPVAYIPGSPSLVPTKDVGGPKSKALEWLDEQAPSSVVYVAFGTMVNVPPPLIFELARGLELSGVPFLWVLRSSNSTSGDISSLYSLLPPGFLNRIGPRGYVETGWAPQLQILQHPATGAFVSHCGWNSSMESISSGVPVLTWHIFGDQPCNARFIVDGLKVGLPVRKQGSTEPFVKGEDVAAAIKALMFEEVGKEVRQNSTRFKQLASGAVREGGSTYRNLHHFVDDILSN